MENSEKILFDSLPEKTKSLILKLKILSERGDGAEKDSAYVMLEKFLTKNNLTINDIENIDEYKKYYTFSYVGGTWVENLLFQIYANVIDTYQLDYKRSKQTRSILFELTPTQFAEISIKFEVYKKQYKIEQEKLFVAFVNAHKLYPLTATNSLNDEEDDLRALSKEEVKRFKEQELKRKSGFYKQAKWMSDAMSEVEIQKRIGEDDNA